MVWVTVLSVNRNSDWIHLLEKFRLQLVCFMWLTKESRMNAEKTVILLWYLQIQVGE
jgi:hypothetical protein